MDCLTDNGKSGTSPELFPMIQNRKLLGMIAFVIVWVCGAMAQAQGPQVALLGGGSASGNAGRIEAFRQGLRELGYTEGKNILIEQRWADGKLDRLAAFGAELVRLKMDIIVSAGPTVTRALRKSPRPCPL
jgi:putative ABC transport system substrate-binding protein